ncbi:Hydantoinase B/oxoprolinase-domain-containing protein [Hypoxylon sp. FL1150]|nr:Hydantoinase B/oxoprolinase-domain-containing protein [Hypoxylon sp. FL1150]
MKDVSGIRIAIDRGGTFTDIHASIPGREDVVLKILSVDPSHYSDAPTEGVRRILEIANGRPYPRDEPIDLRQVEVLRMGTTVGTNALLERKGARSALLITKGFKDLLKIGTQSRPDIFDLSVARPALLYEAVVEIDERITMKSWTENPRKQETASTIEETADLRKGLTGEFVRILKSPDSTTVQSQLLELWAKGYRSLSVVFLHSYLYPQHEQMVGRLAREMGFQVVESSSLQPMIKAVPRGNSATADAYLAPVINAYIQSISKGFKGGLGSAGCRCEFMQSDGGLVDYSKFGGLKSILSGPAGGVVGYAQTTWDNEERKAVIGFDMGGTSTDCSRYAGAYEHVFETTTAGVAIQSPQLNINTVAAGGGSMLFWRDGLFVVGPESAGAHPGPACYRKGGPLAVTDANLFLGRIQAEHFPHIFGPNEDQPLGVDIVTQKFTELASQINKDNQALGRVEFSPEEVALGFLRVADEVMARPIRTLTEARGFQTSDHILASFGGAGGQHACSLARALDISRVVIHKYSSILSAYGLSLADVVHEAQRPAALVYGTETSQEIRRVLNDMTDGVTKQLVDQGANPNRIRHEVYLNMRYEGSTTALMIQKPVDADNWDFLTRFEQRHDAEFGFRFPEKRVLVDDFRVRGSSVSGSPVGQSPFQQLKVVEKDNVARLPVPKEKRPICFDARGRVDTPVYLLTDLDEGARVSGPALILDATLTILVTPKSVATVLNTCLVIDLEPEAKEGEEDVSMASNTLTLSVDPVQLSIFGHRFMSIAEKMGQTLQKTAVSTNIKERLDFSCAIFSPDGGLVANAPHVPVHLGSMQFAVRYQHERWKGQLQEGDVLVSNHPSCGGTHLPDITVITPVFDNSEIVFYVASRGHHADIGGTLPGSMPPNSKYLWEEGAAIEAEKLVSGGVFHDEIVTRLLLQEPAQHPGCSGTRCLSDNLSDLRAQVAANARGINLVGALIKETSLPVVQMYMYAIQDTAERAVRDLLRSIYKDRQGAPLKAIDYMDDGTPIALTITIDGDTGSAVFDMAGTGPQVYGNTNAPVAITHSAIIYSLRCLVASDIPLNQGCLAPVSIKIPPNSILAPGKGASVVGGNVQTSQRIVDVVLKAFGACADSQGCMNNLTFGMGGKVHGDQAGGRKDDTQTAGFGYYETIGGGADPEVFEKRYPCVLREFSIREGSGGTGLHRGGDGIIRDIEFTEPVQVSILSERRTRAPRGAAGGGDGVMGTNLWLIWNIKTRLRETTSLPSPASGAERERQPCSRCRKAGVDCLRAGSGEKQRPVPKSYVHALESQVASLEIFIHKLASSDDQQREQMLKEFVPGESAIPCEVDGTASQLHRGEVDQSMSLARTHAGQLRRTRAGSSAHFYGGTSLFHLHLDGSSIPSVETCSLATTTSPPTMDIVLNQSECHGDIPECSDWPRLGFKYQPHDEVPRRLMVAFFKHQYQYNMCLYREYFLRDYDLCEGRYYSDLLLWAICAVAAVATRESQLCDIFTAQAQLLLYASLDSPNLTLLQALILLGQLEIGRGRASKGWLYCGMAFRLAHEMGLHLDPNNWDDAKELNIEREILRRVYWGAFIVDKQLSLYFGRPPALYPQESDVLGIVRIPYPPDWARLLDTYMAPGTSVTAFEDGIGLVNALTSRAELCPIVHTMITEVFENRRRSNRDNAVVAATVGKIHVSLTKWLAGLPSRLHWNQWTMGQLPPYVYHLHLYFHTIMIILHRPPRQLIKKPALDANSEDVEICYESLGAILRLLRSYSRYYPYEHLPLDFVHTLSTAAGTILMRRHSEDLPWDDAETSRSLDLVLQAMESIQDTWPCMKEIYQGILNARSTAASSMPNMTPAMNFDFFTNDIEIFDTN